MAKYRFDLRDKCLLGRVQHKAGPYRHRGAAAFDPLDDDADGGFAGAGMDRQHGDRPEAAFERLENAR